MKPPGTKAKRESYHRFWAKTNRSGRSNSPFHLLPYHNLDVAAATEVILRKDPLLADRLGALLEMEEEQVIPLVRTLVALHDIGKFSERFQALSPAVAQELGAPTTKRAYVLRHDTLGFGAWKDVLFPAVWEEDLFCLKSRGHSRWDWGDYFEVLLKPIAGHHGSPPLADQWHKAPSQFSEESREAMLDYTRDVLALLHSSSTFRQWDYSHVEKARRASWLLAGLTVVADWIGSDAERFRYRAEPMPLEEYWDQHALPQARNAISETGLLPPPVSSETGLEALFPEYVPTPMQKYASEVSLGEGPELFILEDATGSGKTEAALVIAHRLMQTGKAEGLYVGLPTMATANAMYERLAAAYRRLFEEAERASLALAHSARELSEPFRQSIGIEQEGASPDQSYSAEQEERTAQAQCAAWLADQRKKALLAHVGVGTVDQALLGVLPSDHQSLRLLGLGRSVLVVDEVHAYDVYMRRLLKELLRFQAAHGGSAILLSATLPHSMRQELVDAFQEGAGRSVKALEEDRFPLATHVPAAEAQQMETPVNEQTPYTNGARIRDGYEREVEVELWSEKQKALDELVDTATSDHCACWIRNTVDDARDGWRALRKRFEEEGLDPGKVGLFHARYALADRQAIEERVLARYGKESALEERAGRILVATQVVEQSLDLDFDYMISDLAPIDLLVQRVGRMQRHLRDAEGTPIEEGPDEREGPVFGVFTPPPVEAPSEDWYSRHFPRAAYVYPHVGHLWRTARVLGDEGAIRIPDGARDLIERVYGEDAESLPEPLRQQVREVEQENSVDRSVASGNVLQLDAGYGGLSNMSRWTNEEQAPTRLGEPTTTLRLGRLEGGEVVPWAMEDEHPWRRSELRIRASKAASVPPRTPERRRAVGRAKETMSDNGRWSTLVVLEENEAGWSGQARNDDGEPVTLSYTASAGLTVRD